MGSGELTNLPMVLSGRGAHSPDHEYAHPRSRRILGESRQRLRSPSVRHQEKPVQHPPATTSPGFPPPTTPGGRCTGQWPRPSRAQTSYRTMPDDASILRHRACQTQGRLNVATDFAPPTLQRCERLLPMSSNQPDFESDFADTNAGYFLREFSIRCTHFSPDGETERELADYVIFLDPLFMVFQLKERNAPTDEEARERAWFENKVVKKAPRQIRCTMEYLTKHSVEVENDRGTPIRLPQGRAADAITKLVVYAPGEHLPEDCRNRRFYRSESAGFIHLISAADWLGILRTLITPRELHEYLSFREKMCTNHSDDSKRVSEQALVGHYIVDAENVAPNSEYEKVFSRQIEMLDAFDISLILHKLPEKASGAAPQGATQPSTMSQASGDCVPILRQLALMPRTELRLFKERWSLCWDRCGGEDPLITRFVATSTGTGFLLYAVPSLWETQALIGLSNFSLAHKHEFHLNICIGLSFVRDNEHRIVNWMMVESPWVPNPEMDARLAEFNPLPPLSAKPIPRYLFNE